MKFFAFLSTRKKKVPNQIDLEGCVEVEYNALVEQSPQTSKTSFCTIKYIVRALFLLFYIVFSTAVCRWLLPPLTDNTNPNRTVYLNKSASGFGLEVDWWNNAISEISPGSTSDLDGQLKLGEELLAINGVSLHGKRFDNATVQELLETRHDGVELVVAPMHKDPLWIGIALGFGSVLCAFALSSILLTVDYNFAIAWNRWAMRGTVTRTVTLTKSEDGYGFMMIAGKISEVTSGGPADSRQGLKKGDVVVRVNDVAVEGLWDWRIKQIFNTRANDMILVVRRKAII